MSAYSIGSLVKVRDRDWVVDSIDRELMKLRPLTGGSEESCGIYLPLEQAHITSAVFPDPSVSDLGDFESAKLLRDATRLILRGGAGPFKSFGNIGFRPRPYQLVPLLMALRLDPVRMLIADDVGVGKTIEAGLIAREFVDRGEVGRLAVICPPYLCDQWQEELKNKFNLDAVIIRSNTLAALERALPHEGMSVFQFYRNIIVSIDYVKGDKVREAFLVNSPEMIIVDEAHGCAKPGGLAPSQQKRHEFIRRLSELPEKHLLLVTATPHSGIEESFGSLLGLLKPTFEVIDIEKDTGEGISELAKHFVQRRRADVKGWMDTTTPFPERIPGELPFTLSSDYLKLFREVYRFCRETVLSSRKQSGVRMRVQYWAALSLLRCVMSSPAAAVAALKTRLGKTAEQEAEDAEDFSLYVMDPTEVENIVDVSPTHLVNEAEQKLAESERRKLRQFASQAEQLLMSQKDTKLKVSEDLVSKLLEEQYNPIVFCRFIATAEYVADALKERLAKKFKDVEVVAVTGALAEEDRQLRVKRLAESSRPHVLVATDCLSEGLSLQHGFSAVVHYDLPWNPNRLEQREGRVDRFGQAAPTVKTILVYGQDSPIDATVLKVLLKKARAIHKTLGITVPVPVDSEGILETLLQTLFVKGGDELDRATQIDMFGEENVEKLNVQWDASVNLERASRTRFAQRAIKPDEIQTELDVTDDILGDPATVKRFVIEAFKRLGCSLESKNDAFSFDPNHLPREIALSLAEHTSKLAFDMPHHPEAAFISRNHVLVRTLSEHILGKALEGAEDDNLLAARCGVVRTTSVTQVTTLLVLRARFLIETAQSANPILAEECLLAGFTGIPPSESWLAPDQAEKLFAAPAPSDNLTKADKQEWLKKVLAHADHIRMKTRGLLEERAKQLLESHERLRKTIKMRRMTVKPLFPPDMVSISILLPTPKG